MFGHMNMRFYFGRAVEGLAGLAGAIGHPRAFTAGASATLAVGRQHVRFLDEARAGDALYLTAGVLDVGDAWAEVLQVLHHGDDHQPCAAITTRAAHATPGGRAFPWPDRTREALQALRVAAPDFALPRSTPTGPCADPDGAWDPALARIAYGPATPGECDVFGEMSVEALAGRVSDGRVLAYAPIGRAVGAGLPGVRVGAAAVEYRIDYYARPRAGEMVEVRSRLLGAGGKAIHLDHWLCEPAARRVWAHARAATVHFDLDRRRAVAASREALTRMGFPPPG